MSEGSPVGLSRSGPPETLLEPEPAEISEALADAARGADPRGATAKVVARFPRSLQAWAAFAETSTETMDAYAAYRVGYHRGLDLLRASGWRGSGYLRWSHEPNRAFLRCLSGLQRMAAEIGEQDEAQRCETFLAQLDPDWPPA